MTYEEWRSEIVVGMIAAFPKVMKPQVCGCGAMHWEALSWVFSPIWVVFRFNGGWGYVEDEDEGARDDVL